MRRCRDGAGLKAGLAPGDVIERMQGEWVEDRADFATVLRQLEVRAGDCVVLEGKRGATNAPSNTKKTPAAVAVGRSCSWSLHISSDLVSFEEAKRLRYAFEHNCTLGCFSLCWLVLSQSGEQ